jgi:serine/threonine-protein kinase HipA
MVRIYFVGINVDKFSAKRKCDSGDILRYQAGIYFDNELTNNKTDVEIGMAINRLEQAVKFYAPWIVSYLNPNSTLVASSSFFKCASESNTIYIDGVTNGRKSAIGTQILEGYERFEKDLSINVERIRLVNKLTDTEIETMQLPPECVHSLSNDLPFLSDQETIKRSFSDFNIKYASTERTFMDVVRWDKADPRSLNDVDLIELISDMGYCLYEKFHKTFYDFLNAKIIPNCSDSQRAKLKERLDFYIEGSKLPRVRDALQRSQFRMEVKDAKQTYNVNHFDNQKFKLYNIDGVKWAASGDSWLIPLVDKEMVGSMPVAIKGLMPEVIKIEPHHYEAFFNKSSRFMSNIQIKLDGFPLSPFDYHTHYLTDKEVFKGAVQGIPIFDSNFISNLTSASVMTDLPRISGVQLKMPMNLDLVGDDYVLSVAIDKPFTHILKIPGIEKQGLVAGEWFGLKALESVGAEIAKCQIVPVTQGQSRMYGLVSERFDITTDKSQKILSVDLCTLLGYDPKNKYGAHSEAVFDYVGRLDHNKNENAEALFRLVVGSVLLSNTDLHLKNFSLIKDDRFGLTHENPTSRISPLYDVVVAPVLFGYEHSKQALSINGTFEPTTRDLIEFTKEKMHLTEHQASIKIEDICFRIFQFARNLISSHKEVLQHNALRPSLKICVESVYAKVAEFAPSLESGEWTDIGYEYKENVHNDINFYKMVPELVIEMINQKDMGDKLKETPVPSKFDPF